MTGNEGRKLVVVFSINTSFNNAINNAIVQ